MANVAHKNLTGVDLHEPKGVSTASAGQVYVANGGGSGTWQSIPTADNFTNNFFWAQDLKGPGTAGGAATAGTWIVRDLGSNIQNFITGSLLSANTITLPSGTYHVQGSAPALQVGLHRIRLRNVTDGSDTLIGTSESTGLTGGPVQTRSFINGRFTISGTKNFQIQHMCSDPNSDPGALGASNNIVDMNELYTEIMIWKIN